MDIIPGALCVRAMISPNVVVRLHGLAVSQVQVRRGFRSDSALGDVIHPPCMALAREPPKKLSFLALMMADFLRDFSILQY